MDYPTDLAFNSQPSTVMHLDLNSCFASIEQQANPLYRGKPLVVAAYTSPRGCILAASIEAKLLGIKVGLRVEEGRRLCPDLLVVEPDTAKYRYVHAQFHQLLSSYSSHFVPKSIDEFVIHFDQHQNLPQLGLQIKSDIHRHIGDWLTVSIGIAPNRFLAKVASNLRKPNGLEEINVTNYQAVYSRLALTDLHGINHRLAARLFAAGITTPLEFFGSSIPQLRSAFHSVCSLYWYLRLRGWEIDTIDFSRKSFGNMYSPPVAHTDASSLAPLLCKLVEKTSFRLRRHGYRARGVHLGLLYKNRQFWHRGITLRHQELFTSQDVYRLAFRLLLSSPLQFPVTNLSLTCFDLVRHPALQLQLFDSAIRQSNLSQAVDSLNQRYGDFVLTSARMMGTSHHVHDRIGFGNIGDTDLL